MKILKFETGLGGKVEIFAEVATPIKSRSHTCSVIKHAIVALLTLTPWHYQLSYYKQGRLIEGEGSVQFTSLH